MVSKQTLNGDAFSSSLLGIESRSILKSIQTEYTKLTQAQLLTRSDLHYFRARYNYYRLSLLRLPPEERVVLEPFLGRFIEQIMTAESREGSAPDAPSPFLQSVSPSIKPGVSTVSSAHAPLPQAPAAAQNMAEFPELEASSVSSSSLVQAVGELRLLKLSLHAELGADSKKILADSIDRVISNIQKSMK